MSVMLTITKFDIKTQFACHAQFHSVQMVDIHQVIVLHKIIAREILFAVAVLGQHTLHLQAVAH